MRHFIDDITPLTLLEFIKLDNALMHELWCYRLAAEEYEASAKLYDSDSPQSQSALKDAKNLRNRAFDLADLLLSLRQHYIVHPEDPHDLL